MQRQKNEEKPNLVGRVVDGSRKADEQVEEGKVARGW